MSDFKSRLIQEKDELLDKVTKLAMFVGGDKIDDVSEAQELLLKKQLLVMNDYLNILIIRIELIG